MEAGLSELATGQTVTVSSQSLINGLGFLALFGLGIWLAENALKKSKKSAALKNYKYYLEGLDEHEKTHPGKGPVFRPSFTDENWTRWIDRGYRD